MWDPASEDRRHNGRLLRLRTCPSDVFHFVRTHGRQVLHDARTPIAVGKGAFSALGSCSMNIFDRVVLSDPEDFPYPSCSSKHPICPCIPHGGHQIHPAPSPWLITPVRISSGCKETKCYHIPKITLPYFLFRGCLNPVNHGPYLDGCEYVPCHVQPLIQLRLVSVALHCTVNWCPRPSTQSLPLSPGLPSRLRLKPFTCCLRWSKAANNCRSSQESMESGDVV